MILSTSQTLLLTKPYNSPSTTEHSRNIFQQHEETNHTPFKNEQHALPNIYHFVGPHSLRQHVLQKNYPQATHKEQNLQQTQIDYKMETEDKLQTKDKLLSSGVSSSMMSHGKRSTTRLSGAQIKEFTKEYRYMQCFKQYQSRWDKQTSFIKRESSNRKQPTLLQRSKKTLIVMANPQKEEVLKNYVTSYWEMSLRNNSKILKRHIQGNTRYDQTQLEELLQRDNGIREVESSVPKLPIQQLNKLANGELVVSGKNKLQAESVSCDPSVMSEWSARRSRAASQLPPLRRPEMYRMDYDCAHRVSKDVVIQ